MMPIIVLVLMIAMTVIETGNYVERDARNDTATASAHATGSNMLIVRNALYEYLSTNPSTEGMVALSALPLPAWFTPHSEIRAYVQSGRAYVFVTSTELQADLATALGHMPTALTGVARSGLLVSPVSATQIPLPPQIPDSSVVLMF